MLLLFYVAILFNVAIFHVDILLNVATFHVLLLLLFHVTILFNVANIYTLTKARRAHAQIHANPRGESCIMVWTTRESLSNARTSQ